MRRHHRRLLFLGSLALATFGLLSGCEMRDPPAAKIPRIGFLAVGSREGRAFLIAGFLQGLREHGYVEGQSIAIEYRFSEDRNDRLPQLATELVNLKVKLIVASHPDKAAPRPTDAEVAHTLGITRQQGRRALPGGVVVDCALRADLSRRQSVWPSQLIAGLESETCPGGGAGKWEGAMRDRGTRVEL